jgi:hypothetical protein
LTWRRDGRERRTHRKASAFSVENDENSREITEIQPDRQWPFDGAQTNSQQSETGELEIVTSRTIQSYVWIV